MVYWHVVRSLTDELWKKYLLTFIRGRHCKNFSYGVRLRYGFSPAGSPISFLFYKVAQLILVIGRKFGQDNQTNRTKINELRRLYVDFRLIKIWTSLAKQVAKDDIIVVEDTKVMGWVSCVWQHILFLCFRRLWPGMSLSYREIIECRYISRLSEYQRVYRIEPPISSISIFSKPVIYLVFFRRKFSEHSKNSENYAENSKKSPKILKKFAENSWKRRSFFEAKISYCIE